MRVKQRFVLFAVCAIAFSSNSMANLTFTGTLQAPPPCTISNGNNIDIEFNEIGVNSIDGVNHRKKLNYTINCSPTNLSWRLWLKVEGSVADFDPTAIQTDNPDLGIKVLRNNIGFYINQKLSILLTDPPTIEVIPVKRPNAILDGGDFRATAVLLAYYD